MTEITRGATQTDLSDLLDRVPRASLAFDAPGGIEAVAVGCKHLDGKFWVGFPLGDDGPPAGTHAMLLVDDGWYYFELRGLRVRGMLRVTQPPTGLNPELRWLELEPVKVNAWDYGSMRTRAAS